VLAHSGAAKSQFAIFVEGYAFRSVASSFALMYEPPIGVMRQAPLRIVAVTPTMRQSTIRRITVAVAN